MFNLIRSSRTPGRIIAIGDVHGCSVELAELLAVLKPKPDDQIIFLGDLVNRGPDSVGVLEIFRSLKKARSIVGNHELRLLQYRKEGNPRLLKDYDWSTISAMGRKDWATLAKLEPAIHYPRFNTIFVHGGFLPNQPWQKQGLEITTDIQVVDGKGQARRRGESPEGTPWADLWQGPPFAVYGHTPRPEVYHSTHAIGIDTACVFGGKLTACILPDREIVQVKAKTAYAGKQANA